MPSAFLVAVGYYVGDSNGAPESEEKQKRKEDLIKERTTRRGAEAKEERDHAKKIHAEAHRKTQDQLARLGSQMVEDAKFMKMVEDDVHSGKEAAHSVEVDLQEQERKLREIQFLLTAGQQGSMPLQSPAIPTI